jgi:hypothetical protein
MTSLLFLIWAKVESKVYAVPDGTW